MNGFIKMAKLDFITMKSQFWAYLSFLALTILSWIMGSSFINMCVATGLFMALFSFILFWLQEKNGLDRFYGSVSVSVEDIVLGRYVFVILNFLLSLLAMIVLCFAFSLFQNEALRITDAAVGISLSLLTFSIVSGIQMPMFFKWGYTKAQVWSLLPYIAITILIIFVKPLFHTLSGIVKFIMSSQSILAASGILISCLILLISYRVSVAAYRKRK